MGRYCIEIEAGDDFPDQFELNLADDEAAYAYVVELASARLQSQVDNGRSMVVCATIRDEAGEVLAALRSIAEPLC